MYVNPQNLREYLADQVADPLNDQYYGGFNFFRQGGYYHLGGPGYVLSQATLRLWYNEGYNSTKCFADKRRSEEDMLMGFCLKRAFGIVPNETHDEDGRDRFHNYQPSFYGTNTTNWIISKTGVNCCTPDSIAWHYIKNSHHFRTLHAYYHYCPRN